MKKFMLVLILFVMGYSNVYAKGEVIKLDPRYAINYAEIRQKGAESAINRLFVDELMDDASRCMDKWFTKNEEVLEDTFKSLLTDHEGKHLSNRNLKKLVLKAFMKTMYKSHINSRGNVKIGDCDSFSPGKYAAYYRGQGWYAMTHVKVKHSKKMDIPSKVHEEDFNRLWEQHKDTMASDISNFRINRIKLSLKDSRKVVTLFMGKYTKLGTDLPKVSIYKFERKKIKGALASARCYRNFNKLTFYTWASKEDLAGRSKGLFRAIYIHTKTGYKYIYGTDKHDYTILDRICVSPATANRQAKSRNSIYKMYTRIRMSNGWRPKKHAKQTKRQKRCAKFEKGLLANVEKFKRANPRKDRTAIAYGIVSGFGASTNIRSCQIGKYRFKSSILRTAIKKARIGDKNKRGKRVRVRVR